MKQAITNTVFPTVLGVVAIIGVFAPVRAEAAFFAVQAPTRSYTVGETISLPISVNPEGVAIYTASLNASFSADTLSIQSFTMNDSWMALKQTGYDALDNATGVLVKTGGYPSGTSQTVPFGVIVAKAKKAGTATIQITDASVILDASNVDKQTGSKTVTITAVTPPKPVTKPSQSSSVISTTSEETASSTDFIAAEEMSAETIAAQETANQLAAVGDATSQSGSKLWLWIVLAVVALVVIGFGVRAVTRK